MFPSQVTPDFLIVCQVTAEDQPSFKKEISLTWNSDDHKNGYYVMICLPLSLDMGENSHILYRVRVEKGEEQIRAGGVDQMTKQEERLLFSLGLSYYFARIVHDSSHGGSSVVMMTEEVIFFFHVWIRILFNGEPWIHFYFLIKKDKSSLQCWEDKGGL